MLLKDNASQGKILIALNTLLGGSFLVYHVLLDQHYCLSADDFSGIDYSSQGIPGFTYAWHFYWKWEGPFLSHFIHGSLMWLVVMGVKPVLVLLLAKLGMVFSSAVLAKAVSTRIGAELSWAGVWLFGITFNSVIYLISPNQTEIWHWLTGMVYLYPLIFLQLGTAALLRNRFWLAILALAFVMQSRATYAVLVFGFVVLLSIIVWWAKAENRKQWLILSAFLLLFLVIYLIAPGNYVRMTEHGNSTAFLISQFQIGLQNLFLSYNIAKMDRVFLGLIVVLPLLGTSVSIPRPKQGWTWAVPAVLYVGFAVAHETLFVYITGYCEWTRVLSLHSFLFLVTVCVYGFWFLGLINQQWRAKLWPLSAVGILGLSFHLFTGFGTELQNGQRLKSNYDSRMTTILEHQESGDTLSVQSMNYTGILYFEDFSEDPDNWINYDFRKAYDLDFKVALEKQHER